MTAQRPETLILEGRKVRLCTRPLDRWLSQQRLQIAVESPVKDCLRNYLGQWQLRQGRLYLEGVAAASDGGRVHRPGLGWSSGVSVQSLFPDAAQPVWAQWFTGRLRCPRGKLLVRREFAYLSVWQEDVLIEIEEGQARGMTVRKNRAELPPPVRSAVRVQHPESVVERFVGTGPAAGDLPVGPA
ncbi:MAG: hypothetical protein JWP52_2282 [Rhizobacter sp.]|nr:hypothetical protein [Rhizobacter sp.]